MAELKRIAYPVIRNYYYKIPDKIMYSWKDLEQEAAFVYAQILSGKIQPKEHQHEDGHPTQEFFRWRLASHLSAIVRKDFRQKRNSGKKPLVLNHDTYADKESNVTKFIHLHWKQKLVVRALANFDRNERMEKGRCLKYVVARGVHKQCGLGVRECMNMLSGKQVVNRYKYGLHGTKVIPRRVSQPRMFARGTYGNRDNRGACLLAGGIQ